MIDVPPGLHGNMHAYSERFAFCMFWTLLRLIGCAAFWHHVVDQLCFPINETPSVQHCISDIALTILAQPGRVAHSRWHRDR